MKLSQLSENFDDYDDQDRDIDAGPSYESNIPPPEILEKAINTKTRLPPALENQLLYPNDPEDTILNFYPLIRYVQKCIKNRWPELERELIKNDSSLCSFYAAEIIKGRWPEYEHMLNNLDETTKEKRLQAYQKTLKQYLT